VIADIDLSGKRAIVTGASSGIGVETARALASAGASAPRDERVPAQREQRPAKVARLVLAVAELDDPSLRILAGSEAAGSPTFAPDQA
jgi:NADP-dependent 3-hydroxy acid dehydrogenase YdfG